MCSKVGLRPYANFLNMSQHWVGRPGGISFSAVHPASWAANTRFLRGSFRKLFFAQKMPPFFGHGLSSYRETKGIWRGNCFHHHPVILLNSSTLYVFWPVNWKPNHSTPKQRTKDLWNWMPSFTGPLHRIRPLGPSGPGLRLHGRWRPRVRVSSRWGFCRF